MPTPDKNKAALEGLIAKANAATGGDDTTVTDAVDTLIAGFGQGGGGVELISYANTLLRVFQNADFTGNPDVVVSLTRTPVSCQSAFENVKNVDFITVSSPEGTVSCASMFGNCSVRIIDFSDFHAKISAANTMFAVCKNLTEIKGELDLSLCTNVSNMFRDAGVATIPLAEVRFKAGSIKIATNMYLHQADKLSDASIQSIIDGLADLTGGTAQTLSLHADVGAKLTDAQKAAASAKNWTLAY